MRNLQGNGEQLGEPDGSAKIGATRSAGCSGWRRATTTPRRTNSSWAERGGRADPPDKRRVGEIEFVAGIAAGASADERRALLPRGASIASTEANRRETIGDRRSRLAELLAHAIGQGRRRNG